MPCDGAVSFAAQLIDDETLFGSYLIQRAPCRVVVCLRSIVEARRWPDATHEVRENETAEACAELGAASYEQWEFGDDDPPWRLIRNQMNACYLDDEPLEVVYAPAVEPGGHDHHNWIGSLAQEVFGYRVAYYTTYTRHGGRTEGTVKVEPEPDWIVRKLRALACYRSQIEIPAMRPHFVRGLDEYLEP